MKLKHVLLASAITLGSLSMTYKVNALEINTNVWAHSYSKNKIDHSFDLSVKDDNADHQNHIVDYYIKNENGKILKHGTTKLKYFFVFDDNYINYGSAKVTSDVSGLKQGKYIIKYIYRVGKNTYSSYVYFTKKLNGEIIAYK